MALPSSFSTTPTQLESIKLRTRIKTQDKSLLSAIEVQPSANARIPSQTPTLIKSNKEGMENFTLYYNKNAIGEIDLSPDTRFVEWIANLDSKNLEHVGKALMEFASKLSALKNPQRLKPDIMVDAVSGSSLFYFKLGLRFGEDENEKNKYLSQICSSEKALSHFDLMCNTPVGEMYLDLAKASSGPGDPRQLNALL